jgi:hypothetical protein
MVILPCQQKSILSQRFGANSNERMDFFCADHMPSLTYLSTIHKYYSTSSTSSYVCTCRHVGNSQKRHDIDGPKMEQERQMSPNVGPTFSDMSPTCHLTRQCCVKIANADIRQTQLSLLENDPYPSFNGAVLSIAQIIKFVMASAAISKLAALFITARKMIPHCQTLIDMGWPQPISPIQIDNSTAAGVVNNTIVPRRSKMMDMRFWWLCCRASQDQF